MSGTTLSPWAAVLTAATRRLSSLVRCVAFWTATLLPFVYLPMVAVEPARLVDFRLLGALMSVNLLALVVGHRHRTRDDVADDAPR